MAIYRIRKNRDFTMVSNAIFEDEHLDASDMAVLFWLLSKPDDWVVRWRAVQKQFRMGSDRTAAIRRRLMEAGYIVATRERYKGKLLDVIYNVHESPSRNSAPDTGNPDVVSGIVLKTEPYQDRFLPEKGEELELTDRGGGEPLELTSKGRGEPQRLEVEDTRESGPSEIARDVRALLRDIAEHLDGALGASDRLGSDSGELYVRVNSLLGELRVEKGRKSGP